MFWSVLVVLAAIAFYKFPAFRKGTLILGGTVVLIVVAFYAKQKHDAEVSRRLVHADQLAFTDMALGPEAYGGSYRLTGRVKNNSGYAVFEIEARIDVLDCSDENHCDVVGEEKSRIGSFLPPGQVRDINDSVYFSPPNTRVKGQFKWNYEITEIRARVQ